MIEITQLAGNVGAELTGVQAGGPLTDDEVTAIRQAMLCHKVVFLRDQRLNYDSLVALGERLGELTAGHPIFGAPVDQPFLRELDSLSGTRANHWHTDLTFVDRPPAIALLHGVVLPPVGGDTMWANGVTAYESLPADLRRLADGLRIVHSNDCDYIDSTMPEGRLDYLATAFETEHPAVRVHPETRERALLVGGFARNVTGVGPVASRQLLAMLQDHATRPEHTVRWRWRAGDLAIWDNRATQHYAIADYGSQRRRMERVTVGGDVPVGPDGRASVSLRGDSSAYART